MRLQYPKMEKKAQDAEATLQKVQNELKAATTTRDQLQTEVKYAYHYFNCYGIHDLSLLVIYVVTARN